MSEQPPLPPTSNDPSAYSPEVDVVTQHEDLHTRGEFVLGLGWSCIDCDTFYCPVVNAGGAS